MSRIGAAWRALLLLGGGLSLALLAGCSASDQTTLTPPPGAGNTPRGGGSGSGCGAPPCVTFTVQINFTGEDPLQGSFTDPQTGSGYSSCTQYATDTNTGHGWMGPGSVTQPPTQVEGKTVTLVMGVAEGAYHGPGTYANALTGVIVGSDDFYTGNTSVTVHGDGSGTATFSNLSGLANGTESGTITWTCA